MNNLISKADILQLVPVSDFQRKLLKVYLFGGFRLISTLQNEGQNQSESSKNAIEQRYCVDSTARRRNFVCFFNHISITCSFKAKSRQKSRQRQKKKKKSEKIRITFRKKCLKSFEVPFHFQLYQQSYNFDTEGP